MKRKKSSLMILEKIAFTMICLLFSACPTPVSENNNSPSQTSVPDTPTGLSAVAGNTQVTLTWTAVSGAASYNVYRSTLSGGQGTKIASPTTSSYTDTSLANGTTYYYRVSAVNADGESAACAQQSAVPQQPGSVSIPSTPTGLYAVAGDTQVTLSWSSVSGATSYNVYRSTASGNQGTKIASPTAATYTNLTLSNGTTYYYCVSAVNADGESAVCAQQSATPQSSVPGAPAGLIAVAGNAQVTLSWTAVSGATSYNVYRSTVSGILGTNIAAPTAASYTDSLASNGTTYYYSVSAVSTGGESAACSQQSATPQVPAPNTPTGLTATAGNAQVSLTWTAVSGATSYNVYRSTVSGSLGTNIASRTVASYTNTSLINGTTYYYSISAVNAGGESTVCAQQSATPVSAPYAPTNFRAVAGNAEVSLDWTIVSGATSYNLYWSTSSGVTIGNGTKISGITASTYSHTGLTAGSVYYYIVTAVNAGGESAASGQATGYTFGAPGPGGGFVFFDAGSDMTWGRYLEAAPSDQSASLWWNGNYVSCTTWPTVGTGKGNTDEIVSQQGVGSYAAGVCKNLSQGGKTDWFLPSLQELRLMWTNLKAYGLGGFANDVYWSSTQSGQYAAWHKDFSNSVEEAVSTMQNGCVRAIRAF